MVKNQCSQKTNEKSADASAQNKVWKIIDEAASENQHGNQYLSEVVCKTAADTDAGSTETTELLYKQHHEQTERCAGKTVKKHGEIAEG